MSGAIGTSAPVVIGGIAASISLALFLVSSLCTFLILMTSVLNPAPLIPDSGHFKWFSDCFLFLSHLHRRWRSGSRFQLLLLKRPVPFCLQSIVRVVFHERRLQYVEHQQLEGWRWNRPGDRILDIGELMCHT